MNKNLKAELEKLRDQFPELIETRIDFSESGISVQHNPDYQNQGASKIAVSVCELKEPGPEIISGPSPKLELRKSPVHGYGVFAKEMIEEGELIEELKMLRLDWRRNYVNDPVLNDYFWENNNCNCTKCETHGHVIFLALGLGSMYNHSDNPNTKQSISYIKEVMIIKAARMINKNEEVFISYGKKYFLIRDFMKKVEQNKSLENYLEAKRQPH